MFAQIAEKASRPAGQTIYPREVERVIGALLASSEFWRVVGLSRLPVEAVAEIIKALIDAGLVAQENGALRLTPGGDAQARARGIVPPIERTCPECAGRGLDLGACKELLARFKEMAQNRPNAILEYDQGYVTPETTVARVALLAAKGDIQGKEIIILGDDDLVSVAAALSGLPRRVVVLEIDPRLIHFIRTLADTHNLAIKVYRQDIRRRLPAELCRQFDTFLTDPPETVHALELFLTRGLAALKGPCCAGYFGLTYAESSLAEWLTIQQILAAKLKVVVTDIIHNFNEYVNWDYLLENTRKDLSFVQVSPRANWYLSSMYRIETLVDFYKENRDREDLNLYPD
ncbi:MAG: bis-aminopropyl spermidine synthase family protein [Bacillota bacterium]